MWKKNKTRKEQNERKAKQISCVQTHIHYYNTIVAIATIIIIIIHRSSYSTENIKMYQSNNNTLELHTRINTHTNMSIIVVTITLFWMRQTRIPDDSRNTR